MFQKLTQLGNISIDEFIRDYWQKKPLYVARAFKNFKPPIDADELAGLALDDDVEARLVIGEPSAKKWLLEHGPFKSQRFKKLPSSHWTLLVQHVDALDPRVNAFLNAFRFLPNWRLDDIMVSYAAPGGGVGPHFDYYDVFLIQGEGKRRWRLGQMCNSQSPLLVDCPMKILQQFDCTAEFVCESGDLLYIPPGLAHWGEALTECSTFSVGFRAPAHEEILLELTQELVSDLNPDIRYNDGPECINPKDNAEIPAGVIHALQNIVQQHLSRSSIVAKWWGEYSTRLHSSDTEVFFDECSVTDKMLHDTALVLSPFCRSAYYTESNLAQLFINGESFCSSKAFAKKIARAEKFLYAELDDDDKALCEVLAARGWLLCAQSMADIQ